MLTLIYGPQASGKTCNKEALAKFLGHTTIIDGVCREHRSRRFSDDSGQVYTDLPRDALLLTTMTAEQCTAFLKKFGRGGTVMSIASALKEIA